MHHHCYRNRGRIEIGSFVGEKSDGPLSDLVDGLKGVRGFRCLHNLMLKSGLEPEEFYGMKRKNIAKYKTLNKISVK